MRDPQHLLPASVITEKRAYESPSLVEFGGLSGLTNYSVSIRAN